MFLTFWNVDFSERHCEKYIKRIDSQVQNSRKTRLGLDMDRMNSWKKSLYRGQWGQRFTFWNTEVFCLNEATELKTLNQHFLLVCFEIQVFFNH